MDMLGYLLYFYTSGVSISHMSDSGCFHSSPSSVLRLKGLKYSRRWLKVKKGRN